MKVLWLASWYPNSLHPYDGDFIQRHARAVALYTPVTVFYVAQEGEGITIEQDQVTRQRLENVEEKIILFRFRKTGIRLLDKIRYNILYRRCYKKALREYFEKEGRPDIVHVHIPMKAGVIARWLNIPYMLSEQSSQYSRVAPRNYFTRSLFHRLHVRKIFAKAKCVTNVSATVGNTLKQLFSLPAVKAIHNTVNTDLFYFKVSNPAKFRFIHVSTLTEQKNVEGILRTVSKLAAQRNDFELMIVGPAGAALKKMVQDLSLDSLVTFTGELSYAGVASKMQEASALVLFSRHENFPCVIIEGLCCGLPCIGANVGGVAEAIHENNGILVQPDNEPELKAAMNRLLDDYQRYDRNEISANARQRYGYQVIGKQFVDLYAEMLRTT